MRLFICRQIRDQGAVNGYQNYAAQQDDDDDEDLKVIVMYDGETDSPEVRPEPATVPG